MSPHPTSEKMEDQNLNLPVVAASSPVVVEKEKEKEKDDLRSPPLSLGESLLSLEPAMIIHLCAAIIVHMTVQDLLLEKACRVNLGYSDKVCDALQARKSTDYYAQEEQAIQSLMCTTIMWKTILDNALPIFLIFLLGAWSDKYGRKYPMLLVILTFILQNILLIGSVFVGGLAGAWAVTVISSLVTSLSGNQTCFMSCAFSYMFDHTQEKDRTSRMMYAQTSLILAIALGLIIGGFLANSAMSFGTIFAIALGLEVFALLWLTFFVKNHPLPEATQGKTTGQIVMEVFDFQHIGDAARCVFREREGDSRWKLGLLLFSHACVYAPMMGEMGVMYLFCRYQFNWDAATFGTYMSYRTVVAFVGNCLSIAIDLSDTQNMIIACISNFVTSVLFAFATSSSIMYLCPIISLLSGSAMAVPRSMLSKIIPSDELGKINSCISCMESILPVIAGFVYPAVYMLYLSVLPGSFFLITAVLSIPPLVIFWRFKQSSEEPDPTPKKTE